MPRYVCKLDGLYFEWSTVVDAPVTPGMTLPEFEAYYRDEYGRSGFPLLAERLARVEATGTSSLIHRSVDEVIEHNRAGRDERCATREQIVAGLRAAKKKSVRERLGRDKSVPGHPGDPELLR